MSKSLNKNFQKFLLVTVFLSVGFSATLDAHPLEMGAGNAHRLKQAYAQRDFSTVMGVNVEEKARYVCRLHFRAWGANWETCNEGMKKFFYQEIANVKSLPLSTSYSPVEG